MAEEKVSESRSKKQGDIKNLVSLIENATAIYLTDYTGIDVANIMELRNRFRKSNVRFKVVKNTLFRCALREKGIKAFENTLKGPIAVAVCDQDETLPAKIITEFQKENKGLLPIRGGFLEDQELSPDQVEHLAKLPGKKEMLGRLVIMALSPGSNVSSALLSPGSGIMGCLDALIERLEGGTEKPDEKEN
jgi:large subunit ribosomal protein L10